MYQSDNNINTAALSVQGIFIDILKFFRALVLQ